MKIKSFQNIVLASSILLGCTQEPKLHEGFESKPIKWLYEKNVPLDTVVLDNLTPDDIVKLNIHPKFYDHSVTRVEDAKTYIDIYHSKKSLFEFKVFHAYGMPPAYCEKLKFSSNNGEFNRMITPHKVHFQSKLADLIEQYLTVFDNSTTTMVYTNVPSDAVNNYTVPIKKIDTIIRK